MQSEDLMPIGELARRTGVNPVTLRAWERRYGLLEPQRTAKGHRLYGSDQVEQVQAILRWLERGASVGQVRELLEHAPSVAPQGDWQLREQALIEAVGNLSQRTLDQQLNQAMALYPAVTLCEQLLLPLLHSLARRWQTHFNARLEQAFFHTWLRSKFGARVYHDNQQLTGPPVLLVVDSDRGFDAHLWLCAWLFTSSGRAAEVLEFAVAGAQLQRAVSELQAQVLVLLLGPRVDYAALERALHGIDAAKLLGGETIALHQTQLEAMQQPGLSLFDTPQAALRLLQQPALTPPETTSSCN